ncbi:MAG: hypothetical protein NZ828_01330 [Alphaproteobacteria bacterium]|nr:hypothetical protein [Alphaproteobacteria bacterium]|tara:strand:+ start:816 stop:980 length:165 start_codon:yes stop_codon:yes gene_type:complete
MVDKDNTTSSESESMQTGVSKNRRARNFMILGLILGLVAIIWVVTMLKITGGAS